MKLQLPHPKHDSRTVVCTLTSVVFTDAVGSIVVKSQLRPVVSPFGVVAGPPDLPVEP